MHNSVLVSLEIVLASIVVFDEIFDKNRWFILLWQKDTAFVFFHALSSDF